MGKTPRFNDKEDTFIIKLMPKCTPRQISNHWNNHLYPNLCHDPLWKSKKDFIVKRIEWIQWNHKRLKSKPDVLHMLKIWIEDYYHYESNMYCDNEKNHIPKRLRKHLIHLVIQLNKRYSDNKFRNFCDSRQCDSSRKSNLRQKNISSNVDKQINNVKQEQQYFNLPLPSSGDPPPYIPSSQNDSYSRIPVEHLLNESNYFPELIQAAREYFPGI